ncbi:CvpA family protein [Candidatus Nomurabacteria bacterium]|nr:CvpA family protein [Candidatus Nomurabacteria bacterium]
MNWLDIIIVVLVLFFVFKGFRAGLVGAIGGFLGIILGIWAGSHFMSNWAAWIMSSFNLENQPLANILAFVGIFVAINLVISIGVWIVNKIFHIIPFINLANKLLGALIGFIGGVLAVSALVYLLSLFPFSQSINDVLISSQFADWAVKIAIVVKPLIPEAIKSLKSIV